MKKYILMALSLLIFLPNSAYMLQAWRSSRLDSWDWVFFLLAVPALIWAWEKKAIGKWDWRAFFVVIPALAAVAARSVHQINALSVAGSIFFVWGTAFLAGNWNFAYKLLPVLGQNMSKTFLKKFLETYGMLHSFIFIMMLERRCYRL